MKKAVILIKYPFSFFVQQSGAKCLHIAAAAGHVEVVRSLLNKGESVDIKTNVSIVLSCSNFRDFLLYFCDTK